MTRPFLRRIAAGGAWALIGRSAMVLGSFTINILVVRLLPPNEVGLYFLLVSAIALGVVLGQFGLKKTTVRLISSYLAIQDDSMAARIALTCLKIGLAASLLVACLFGLATPQIFSAVFDVKLHVAITSLGATWVFFRAMKEIIGETFRGYHLMREASLLTGASEQIAYALLLLVLLTGVIVPSLVSVIASGTTAAIISMLIASRLLYLKKPPIPDNFDKDSPNIIRMALPFFVSGVVLFTSSQVDIWALGATQTKEDVAVYAAVKRLLLSLLIPLAIVNDILPPLISELFEKQQLAKLEHMLRGVALAAAVPAMLVLTVLIFGAEAILVFLFGPYYGIGAKILVILSLGQFVNVLTGSCSNVLAMTGHQNLVMRVNLATGFITIIACGIMAHVAGVIGVAVTMATMIAGQNIVMLVLTKRATGVWSHVGSPQLALIALKQMRIRPMND